MNFRTFFRLNYRLHVELLCYFHDLTRGLKRASDVSFPRSHQVISNVVSVFIEFEESLKIVLKVSSSNSGDGALIYHFLTEIKGFVGVGLGVVSHPRVDFHPRGALFECCEPSRFVVDHSDIRSDQMSKNVKFLNIKKTPWLSWLLLLRVFNCLVFKDTRNLSLALLFFHKTIDSVEDARNIGKIPDRRPLHRIFIEHR